MGLDFNVLAATAAGGRRGRLQLPHRSVETPLFMPVGTLGSVKAIPHNAIRMFIREHPTLAGTWTPQLTRCGCIKHPTRCSAPRKMLAGL